MNDFFVKDNGIKLPNNIEKYLKSVLSNTAIGTNYWDPPPPSEISLKQIGRIILQVHQILDIAKSFNINLNNKSFIDLGTGNGMIPRLMLEVSKLSKALGTDPFLDGEHSTSWQKHSHVQTIEKLKNFLNKLTDNNLSFEHYSQLTNQENVSFIPQDIIINKGSGKNYFFKQIGIHEIHKINEKFDFIYCKAIEHINNWDKAFSSVSEISNNGSIFYLKHRSFFSYLGPHRYGSIGIPWGHLLLNKSEYVRYVEENFDFRSKKMIDFFFNDLTFPRMSVSDMIKIGNKNGFILKGIKIEPTKYNKITSNFVNDVVNFWDLVKKNFPHVSSEEIFSGIYHVVFEKN